jgi:hypothetical protein
VDKIYINDNYIESDVGEVLQLLPGGNTTYDNNGSNSTDHKVHIVGDLTVDGSINFTGDFIQTDTIVKVTEQLDISNDGTGPAVIITQYGNNDILKVLDCAQLSSSILYYVRISSAAPYFIFSSTRNGPALNNAEHPFILIKGTSYTFETGDGSMPSAAFAVGDYSQPGSGNFTNTSSGFVVTSAGGASFGTAVTNSNGTTYTPLNVDGSTLSFSIPENYNNGASALAYFDGNVGRNV